MHAFKIYFTLIILVVFISCSDDEIPPNNIDPSNPELIFWNGPDVNFTKEDNTDPNLEENQDRIVDDVWITRGINGGQIYNAAIENDADKTTSPQGTEWAIGTLADIENLIFEPFRATVGEPKSVVGKDLVLHLIDSNIYIEIRFSSWTQGKAGGFSYERSTE